MYLASYHYAPASDDITVKNQDIVAEFVRENRIPYVTGRTWTADSFYRETVYNFKQQKTDGCISVEMKCAALQAMCDFRGLNLYGSLQVTICRTHRNGTPGTRKVR